jgi:amino acid transporter
MIGILWAYEGWQYVTFSAGETRDPQRVFPRAIAAATAALIALYMIANFAYVAALGVNGAAASDHVAADATRAVFGPLSGKFFSVLVLVSIFSAANGVMLTAPRLYYSMARDGVFFALVARTNATEHRRRRSCCSPSGRRCSRRVERSSSCSPMWSSLGGFSTGLVR